MLEAEGDAVRARYDLSLFAAWHVEAFARAKKLPDLAGLLARRGNPPGRIAVAEKIRTGMSVFQRSDP